MVSEEEKKKATEIGLEPEVVFNSLSDRIIYAVKNEDEEIIFEISGYDVQIKFNTSKIHDYTDIESLLEGIKQLFEKILMQTLFPPSEEKTNSEE